MQLIEVSNFSQLIDRFGLHVRGFEMEDKDLRMKYILGTKKKYAITREGNVWSYPKKRGISSEGKWLTPTVNKNGYLQVRLHVDGKIKAHYVHRLVALGFIPNPNHFKCIRHKDGNKSYNHRSNLEWTSQSLLQRKYDDESLLPIMHGDFLKSLKKLHKDDIIKAYVESGGVGVNVIAEHYGASRYQIFKCLESMTDDEREEVARKRAERWEIRIKQLIDLGVIKA
jgi:hypothetical protein